MARALKVSIQQIHKYETAKSSLPAGKLFALSRAKGVDPAYFFDGLENEDAASAPPPAEKPALGR